jgi:hypothetical protein
MINLFLNKELLTKEDVETAANYGGQDIFLLVPFLSENLYYNIFIPKLGNHNDSLYTKPYFSGNSFITQTTIENCDYSVIPFKFNNKDSRVSQICDVAKKHNKSVIAFYTDDNTDNFQLPENLILFRTSITKNNIQKNERVMPALHPDHFSGFTDHCNSLSFCGQNTQLRHKIFQALQQTDIKTDFIIRQGFWAPEINSKIKARKQYYQNLINNKFALCVRGSGNFSFRFYESLCFGRVSILIDTDVVLPFSNKINWSEHIIAVKPEEIQNLPELLKQSKHDMKNNRKLWKKFFSIEGYTRNFYKEI